MPHEVNETMLHALEVSCSASKLSDGVDKSETALPTNQSDCPLTFRGLTAEWILEILVYV